MRFTFVVQNVRADHFLVFSVYHDYSLFSSWLSHLHSHLVICRNSIFADRVQHHLPRYASRVPDHEADLIEAFSFIGQLIYTVFYCFNYSNE